MSKNLQKVQDMLDGNYKNKIQSGYIGEKEVDRKIGDIWTDSDGIEWEQKNGYRMKVSKLANAGIFKGHCKDCNTGILKPWDVNTFKGDGRCYYCQIDYEAKLKTGKNGLKWFAYRRLKDFQNMKSIEKDMIQWIDDMEKQKQKNPFDKKVANAIANNEVTLQINKVTNKLV